MIRKHRDRLLMGPPVRVLARLSSPLVLGIFSVALFNITDTFFVAQLGTIPLAAMSFLFPIKALHVSLATGLGAAVTSILSRSIGEDDIYRMRRITTDGLVLALLLSALVAWVGIETMHVLFPMLGAGPKTLKLIMDYMALWYMGYPLVMLPIVVNAAIRAAGNTRFPSFMMVVSTLVNLVAAPILIFGLFGAPRLELQGAAISNVLAYGVTAVWALYKVSVQSGMVTLKLRKPYSDPLISWYRFVRIGLPAFLTSAVIPLTMTLITRMMSDFGTQAVAAYGLATRVESFAHMLLVALSMALVPFVGQNWGAQKFDRVRIGMIAAFAFCLGWGGLMAILFHIFGAEIAGLFKENAKVVVVAVLYFSYVPIGYIGQGMIMSSNAFLNAIGHPYPLHATLIVFTRALLLYVPLAYLGKEMIGMEGIFIASMSVNLTVGLVSALWVYHVYYFRRRCLEGPRQEKPADAPLQDVTDPLAEISPALREELTVR